MFKLESNKLKREFKITNGNFYASQIHNKISDMGFVPDGNGCEFVIFFTDGSEVSSKGLPVLSSSEENNKLKFIFDENLGTTVTLEYWIHEDGNTICKQITISQNNDKVIDRVFLENVGIINSKTHFGIDPATHKENEDYVMSLGQPFYIDSLFFGCESPAVDSKIIHGAGQIRYYIGKNVGKDFKCPVTVIGGGKDNTMQEMQRAFYDYIDTISLNSPLQFSFYESESAKRTNSQQLASLCDNALKSFNTPDMPHIDSFIEGSECWLDDRAKALGFNKNFPNGLSELSSACADNAAQLGISLNAAIDSKLAKKLQKAGDGFIKSDSKELCCASARYNDKLAEFLCAAVANNNLGYVELAFGINEQIVCTDESHDHTCGGKNNMYFVTDLVERRIELLKKLRSVNPDITIVLNSLYNLSPWWRQWANAFCENGVASFECDYKNDEISALNKKLTYEDTAYFYTRCYHASQAKADCYEVKLSANNLSNDEFYAYVMWKMAQGASQVKLDMTMANLDDNKRASLSKALKFKEECQHILKNCTFIGGNPCEENIYGFVSWSDENEGIIALRNPSDEKTSLTLTLNKLMGVPENLEGARRENIYSLSVNETDDTFSYGDKFDLTLHAYECVILKFTV
ncbi:MAG: hypothetical protein IJS03_00815 [Eubacterium sp.]|nr:hypothetical protein [Eubacterium sp.]